MNRRRDLLIVLGAAAFGPQVAIAQSKQAVVLIGWLNTLSHRAGGYGLTALKEGLAALGWKEGSNIAFEERWADGQTDGLPALAAELASKRPALIVAFPLAAVVAAAKGAPGIPIVLVNTSDPVATGLAASLARPGGMVTGVTNMVRQVSEKYLELLLNAAPKLQRIGFLVDSASTGQDASLDVARRSAQRHSVEARIAKVARPEEVEPALSRLVKEGVQGLVLLPSDWLAVERQRIIKLALAQRWPVIGGPPQWAEEGALLSYGADRPALFRRAAYYVDRILKGAKPGDLPIEQPTRFELVVNLKTAKALGLTLPQPFLIRVDRVIE